LRSPHGLRREHVDQEPLGVHIDPATARMSALLRCRLELGAASAHPGAQSFSAVAFGDLSQAAAIGRLAALFEWVRVAASALRFCEAPIYCILLREHLDLFGNFVDLLVNRVEVAFIL